MYSFKRDTKWIHRDLPYQSGAEFIHEWEGTNTTSTDNTVLSLSPLLFISHATTQSESSRKKKQVLVEEKEAEKRIIFL